VLVLGIYGRFYRHAGDRTGSTVTAGNWWHLWRQTPDSLKAVAHGDYAQWNLPLCGRAAPARMYPGTPSLHAEVPYDDWASAQWKLRTVQQRQHRGLCQACKAAYLAGA
jgi:hypothetical protein